jgi:predicted outer membrane protein
MNIERPRVRPVLRGLLLSAVTATVAVGTVGPAQAHANSYGSVAAAQRQQAAASAVQLDTQERPLTAGDRALVVNVRLAGLWEIPAGKMAMEKGASPRVRQVGQMIANQHVQLDALDKIAAKQLDIKLPNQPSAQQRRWLDEMTGAKGTEFDAIFAQRLRAAHGKIFPLIGAVRASTENDVVRKLAQQSNQFVLTHLTLLESTGMVQYEELPPVAAPATGPIAAAGARSASGGIAVPLIWLILGVALVTGMVATSRMVRPRAFGGRHGGIRPDTASPVPQAPRGADDYLYPPARQLRVRSTQ